jgi:cell division protein FtsN
MGLLCVGMAVFIYHTISYLKTPEPVAKTEIVIKERVPKPFTIQVAAYLADSHASDYVSLLTRQGVDARIKKTTAGGKTWYLIHVSEFENRKTAATYGNQLKSEHIIEEFFVTNKE